MKDGLTIEIIYYNHNWYADYLAQNDLATLPVRKIAPNYCHYLWFSIQFLLKDIIDYISVMLYFKKNDTSCHVA